MKPAAPSSAGNNKGSSDAKPSAVNPAVAKPADHAKEEKHAKPDKAGDHHVDGIIAAAI